MKLKLIEPKAKRGQSPIAKVSVNKKGGFYFSTKAMQLLKVIKPVKVSFFQDQENKRNWFLRLNPLGSTTLNLNSKDGGGQFQNKSVAKLIMDSYPPYGDQTLQFKLLEGIAYHGDTYYPLTLLDPHSK